MKDILEFIGILLIATMVGGLIYAIVKKKLALGISLVAGLLVVGVLWWWLSSPPTPNEPTEAGTLSQTLQSPSPKEVWEWTKNYWLWIILILGIPFFLLYIVKEPWAKALQGFLAVVVTMFFVVIPLVYGIWGEKAHSQQGQQQQTATHGCNSASPCTLVVRTDGSTKKERIPQGKSVCFEPYFWSNIQQLGYKTSYKGGTESGTGVSADTFWFVPEAGTKVPRYWFVPIGTQQC